MEDEYRKIAKEILENHEYKLITKNNASEIWHCGRGTSSNYAFSIAIMPMGIAVVGDIGELVFDVARDMEFLAGNDVDYYIQSKLAHISKEREYAEEEIRDIVLENIKNYFQNDNEYIYEIFGDEKADKLINDTRELTFKELRDYIKKSWKGTNVQDESYEFIDQLNDLITNVSELSDSRSAYELLDKCEVIEFHDVFEYPLERSSKSMMQRLYIVNEAARNIVALSKED